MPTTKKPLKRYSILDRCFSNTGRNYTFEGLKEAVNEWMLDKDPQSKGISTRQLRDDISFMRSSDGWEAPIVTVPGVGKQRYYRYEEAPPAHPESSTGTSSGLINSGCIAVDLLLFSAV